MVDHPQQFFADRGDLHDARLQRLTIEAASATVILAINDLHANFVDLPDDPGRLPATLRFSQARDIEGDFGPVGVELWIYALTVRELDTGNRAELLLCPGGRIAWTFAAFAVDP